jgi:hypothetical protein
MRTLTLWLLLVGATAGTAFSGTITSATAGTGTSSSAFWFGQDFNTPTGGPWNDITFNFVLGARRDESRSSRNGFSAKRSLFRHAGGAQRLNAGVSRFDRHDRRRRVCIRYRTAVAAQYTLLAIYENAQFSVTGGPNNGGVVYFAASSTSDFSSFADSANFLVTGTVTTTPEPASWGLLLLGCSTIGLGKRLLRRTE